jgi:hypothetical protein
MKVERVTLTLAELQKCLADYFHTEFGYIPDVVIVQTHGKQISIELAENGLVAADEFAHRAQ